MTPTTAAERLAVRLPEGDPDLAELLTELAEYRAQEQDQRELREIAARQGFSGISIYNDLLISGGTLLTRHAGVRFRTGAMARDYLELTMPTTRDEGWVQISTGDFRSDPTMQLRGGMLMLKAIPR